MNHSTHFNLNLPTGTDIVNPLTVDVPNYQEIDEQMYLNQSASVGTATELKTGTVHAITRARTNQNVFRFKATSVFNVGDTFTVDGGNVTALYVDGSTLKDRCFIIGSDVLCILNGASLTVMANYVQNAEEVPFDSANVILSALNVQRAIENASLATGTSYDGSTSVKTKIDSIKSGTLMTVTRTTGETWLSLLNRLKENFESGYTQFWKLRLTVDGNSNTIFTPVRWATGLSTWFSVRGSGSAIVLYLLSTSSTSAALRKYQIGSGGLTVTDLTAEQAESDIRIIGLATDVEG